MDGFDSTSPPAPQTRRLPGLPLGIRRRLGQGAPAIPDSVRGLLLLLGLIIFIVVYVYVLARYGSKALERPTVVPLVYRFVDDAQTTGGFTFVGGWQRVAGVRDGRSYGTSTRSLDIGARATLVFIGRSVRVYGVTGPNGGTAAVTIDGRSYGSADFHNTKKDPSTVVFQSPVLPQGGHTLSLIVEPMPANAAGRGYVNIDGASYSP